MTMKTQKIHPPVGDRAWIFYWYFEKSGMFCVIKCIKEAFYDLLCCGNFCGRTPSGHRFPLVE